MRVFDKFNATAKDPCPVCETKTEKLTVLVPIDGTDDGQGNVRALQVHLECLDLHIDAYKEGVVIYQVCEKRPIIQVVQ